VTIQCSMARGRGRTDVRPSRGRPPGSGLEKTVPLDDRELVGRLERGEEDAWREFLSSRGRLIRVAAARCGLPPDQHDEVLQETCRRMLVRLPQLGEPYALGAWVYRIARSVAVDLVRRSARERTMESDAVSALLEDPDRPSWSDRDDPRDVDEALDLARELDHLARAMGSLDERCRRLLEALYLEEPRPSYRAIGSRLELAVGSIGPIRARCLARLRARLEEAVSSGG